MHPILSQSAQFWGSQTDYEEIKEYSCKINLLENKLVGKGRITSD